MMLILKIPIVYLALVVWYAIRAEPEPGVDPNDYSVWRPWQKPKDRGRAAAARMARATRPASSARVAIESQRDLGAPRLRSGPSEAVAGSWLACALFLGAPRARLSAVPARSGRR